MKIFESISDYKTKVENGKLIFEIPITTLANSFDLSPVNEDGTKVKKGKEELFAEHVAECMHEETQEDGANFITDMFDAVFEFMGEGFFDASDCIQFPEDD